MTKVKSLAAVAGATLAVSLSTFSVVSADDNPFSMTDLTAGSLMAEDDKGTEGKCGEGKCGEGKCGDKKGGEQDQGT